MLESIFWYQGEVLRMVFKIIECEGPSRSSLYYAVHQVGQSISHQPLCLNPNSYTTNPYIMLDQLTKQSVTALVPAQPVRSVLGMRGLLTPYLTRPW